MGQTKEVKLKQELQSAEHIIEEALSIINSSNLAIHSLGHNLDIIKTDIDEVEEQLSDLDMWDESWSLHKLSATLEALLEVCKLNYRRSNSFLEAFQADDDENEEE